MQEMYQTGEDSIFARCKGRGYIMQMKKTPCYTLQGTAAKLATCTCAITEALSTSSCIIIGCQCHPRLTRVYRLGVRNCLMILVCHIA